MVRLGLLSVVLAVLVLAIGATPTRVRAEEDGERLELHLPQPIPVQDFLRLVKKHLDVPLVWDPKSRALQNKEITPDLSFAGSRAEIMAAVRGLLTAYELVLIPVGTGDSEQLFVMDARQTQHIMRLKPRYVELTRENLAEYEAQDGLFVTTTIAVENLESLRDARNALNRLMTVQLGSVTEVPDARAFVVTDFAPNAVAVYRLIRAMDVPVAERDPEARDRAVAFEAFHLEHAPAGDAARLLRAHFATEDPAPRRQVHPANQQGSPVPADPLLRIHADERLNQILVTGMRKDVERVREVLKTVDVPAQKTAMWVHVVALEHLDAIQAAATLTSLIQRGTAAWVSKPGAADLPVVEPHRETNSLLIAATPQAFETLKGLLTEMDQPKDAGAGAK